MMFITQTNTGTMVKRVPQRANVLALEANLQEIYFLLFLGFVMLILDVLNLKFLSIISLNAKVFSDREQVL